MKALDTEKLMWSQSVDESKIKLPQSKIMFARGGYHKILNYPLDAFGEDYVCILYGTLDFWIGYWITGLGYFNVQFPKAWCRDLTEQEMKVFLKKRMVIV